MLPISDATSLACLELRRASDFFFPYFFFLQLVMGLYVTVASSLLCQVTAVEK